VDKCLIDSLDKWLCYRISNSFGGLGVCLLGVLRAFILYAQRAWISPLRYQITNMSPDTWTLYQKEQILTQSFGISAFVIRYLIHSEDWSLFGLNTEQPLFFLSPRGLAKSNS
jgi:hypothetical protein